MNEFKILCSSLLMVSLLTFSSIKSYAVINGNEVKKNSEFMANSIVALQMREFSPEGQIYYHKGTGIIVGEDLILTAGHNVFYHEDPRDIEIIFSLSPCWKENLCHEIRIQASKRILHPNFLMENLNPPKNDIALLRLESKIPSGFSPIKIGKINNKKIDKLLLLGYGQNKEMHETVSLSDFKLRKLELIPDLFGHIDPGKYSLITIPQKYGGFCAGDSGGLLFAISEKDESYLIGIVSYVGFNLEGNMSCATEGYYSDTTYYFDWISKEIKN